MANPYQDDTTKPSDLEPDTSSDESEEGYPLVPGEENFDEDLDSDEGEGFDKEEDM